MRGSIPYQNQMLCILNDQYLRREMGWSWVSKRGGGMKRVSIAISDMVKCVCVCGGRVISPTLHPLFLTLLLNGIILFQLHMSNYTRRCWLKKCWSNNRNINHTETHSTQVLSCLSTCSDGAQFFFYIQFQDLFHT